jgi:vacuolar-type H+-ATPase subunit I/STV1
MQLTRVPSSVYSETLDLGDPVLRLPVGDHPGAEEIIRALESKRDDLQREVEEARSTSNSIYRTLTITAKAAEEILHIYENIMRHEKRERNKFLANCTAI